MSFSETTLLKKFQELNSTQQSVQTLSLWLIHHRKNAGSVCATWLSELQQSPKPERKLTFIYLANDILQNSRRKGDEYLNEFKPLLNDAFEHTAQYSDEKTKFTLERYESITQISIWHFFFEKKEPSHRHASSSEGRTMTRYLLDQFFKDHFDLP
jgi:regulator of Ty1 transposition protein 103